MATVTVSAGSFLYSDLYGDLRAATLGTATATRVTYKTNSLGLGSVVLSGTNLVTDSAGKLVSGTVTGIAYSGFDGLLLWTMTNLSLGAAKLQAGIDAYRTDGVTTSLDALFASQTWSTFGDSGNDAFVGGGRADTLRGDWGDDTFVGGAGADTILGGPIAGNVLADVDTVGFDYDTVNYGRESGTGAIAVDLTKTAGNVTDTFGSLDTLSGVELIVGTARADSFRGNDGALYEAFTGGAGADTIDGGGGLADEMRYDLELGALGVSVDLAAGTATDTYGDTDRLANIERVRGSLNADTLRGNALDNVFVGLAGADVIVGGAGSDTVRYDLDARYTTGQAGIRVELQASVTNVAINGVARDGFGTVDRLSDIENVYGTEMADRILGTDGANTLRGNGGADYLLGRAGDDTLLGGDGNDKLAGGDGSDTIDGGNAADTLFGGAGRDRLTGGAGYDTFVFDTSLSATRNLDTITDFDAAADTLRLENGVFKALTATGPLASAAFATGTAATTAAQRILYDTATGYLAYDADGNGSAAAVRFAQLLPGADGLPGLSSANFVVS